MEKAVASANLKCPSKNLLAPLWIATLLLSLSVLALKAELQSTDTQTPKGGPVLGERIAGGLVFEGRLWLVGTMASSKDCSGGLISLALANESRQVHFERGVVDIQKFGHDLWVLRRSAPDGRDFVVSVWRNGIFEELARFTTSDKDEPIALSNSANGLTVLSTQAIRILSGDQRGWLQVKLQGKMRGGFQDTRSKSNKTSASPINGNSIYVGFNTGEWGGGLQRVDLRTGIVTNVERRDTKELCAGPLNSACDPVTGVIPDPQNRECILAAVGLVHMLSHGRILRVCGKKVSLVFEKPITIDDGFFKDAKMSEAFFGLVPSADGGFWGLTSDALYHFGEDGTKKEEYPLPKLAPVSGIYLRRELPGVIVVRTDANWPVSLSGYTPLVIPLEEPEPKRELSH